VPGGKVHSGKELDKRSQRLRSGPELAAKYLRTPYKHGTAADADRLMEEAGRRLVYGPFDLEDVKTIVEWKSARRMDRFKLNSPEQVEAAIREAIEATKAGDVRRAVKALTKLAGVKLKMASAILTDAGTGSVAYTYNSEDVSVTGGPASTGENAKSKQSEYDGLGPVSNRSTSYPLRGLSGLAIRTGKVIHPWTEGVWTRKGRAGAGATRASGSNGGVTSRRL
jgi:hypothetical protein